MERYFLYGGTNEVGPLTVDELRLMPLSRTTPMRLEHSNRWTTPDKLAELRAFVVPKRPIRSAADLAPVVRDRVLDLHYQRPVALYGGLLALALFSAIGIYSSKTFFWPGKRQSAPQEVAGQQKQQPTPTVVAGIAAKEKKDSATKEAGSEKPKATPPANWRQLISVQKSNYGYGVLGGISNLQINFSNGTDFVVDEATAKITYIKANGKVWKHKMISVKNMKPHSRKSVEVENVYRSKKVTVQLHQVRSRAMGLDQLVK